MTVREPTMSEHAKKILEWRESFLFLEENHFFELMRMYLGEIKTPYNKQKLIASLEGFLHRRENLVAIKSFLSFEEMQIICAVVYIPDATLEKLTLFFENSFTYSFVYETVLNLEDRLIFYSSKKENSNTFNVENQFIIKLNPLLEDAFFDFINLEMLLPLIEPDSFTKSFSNVSTISQEFIACFVSFVIENSNLAKQDGTLKKYALEAAKEIFLDNVQQIETLYKAFLNLNILTESGRGVEVNWNKLNKFCELSFNEQLIYIVVASSGHFGRESLRLQAQFFVDTLTNLEGKFFTKDLFLKTGFLVACRPKAQEVLRPIGSSRFAKMIEEGRARLSGSDKGQILAFSESGALERIFESAVLLGCILECGKTQDGESVFKCQNILDCVFGNGSELCRMLNVDAGMDVNLMPGYSLKDILPITKFMCVKRFDTVSTFSINKQSVMHGFDLGLTENSILKILSDRMKFELPQSICIQIEDWNASYSSASFYKGYILKVEGKAALFAEHNKVLAPHIHSVIAPGVFLLDVSNDAEAFTLIKESGLDFIGKIKTATQENVSTEFFAIDLKAKKLINARNGFEVPKEMIERENSTKIEKALIEELNNKNLTAEQQENFELRISQKFIINASQIEPRILRLERVNADTMDFAGKVYIVEQAIKAKEKIELKFGAQTLFGVPLAIVKRQDEAFVEIQLIPENVVREYSIGQAKFVKRINDSIWRKV